MSVFGVMRSPGIVKTGTTAHEWAGRTVLNSGSATVTVSTTIIQSNSIILFNTLASTRQSSGQSRAIEVSSPVPGVSFAFSTADGVAIPRDTLIMWTMIRTS